MNPILLIDGRQYIFLNRSPTIKTLAAVQGVCCQLDPIADPSRSPNDAPPGGAAKVYEKGIKVGALLYAFLSLQI